MDEAEVSGIRYAAFRKDQPDEFLTGSRAASGAHPTTPTYGNGLADAGPFFVVGLADRVP
jgi:hypothetical protein